MLSKFGLIQKTKKEFLFFSVNIFYKHTQRYSKNISQRNAFTETFSKKLLPTLTLTFFSVILRVLSSRESGSLKIKT